MFSKIAFTFTEQVNQLQERGLEIPNPPLAERYLAPNALGMKPHWQEESFWK